MIYGYEEPVAMPTMGVYDTSLMKAYIAGAKEQYEQSQAEMKDYMKQYSDFYSPIAGDNEAYYNETIGRVNSLMLLMQENGIDPFKSPEARAAIQRLIYSTNTAALGAMKRNAANYLKYLENKSELQSKNLFSQELEDMELEELKMNPSQFSTIQKDGSIRTWNRLSPSIYQDANQLTSNFVDQLQPSDLGPVEGMKFTRWKGIQRDQLNAILPAMISKLENTASGRLLIKKAYLIASMRNPNADKLQLELNASEALKDIVISANAEKFQKNMVTDEEQKIRDNQNFQLRLKQMEIKATEDENEKNRENARLIAGLKNNGTIPESFSNKTLYNVNEKRAEHARINANYYLNKFVELANGGKVKSNMLTLIENHKDDDIKSLQKLGFFDKNGNPTDKMNTVMSGVAKLSYVNYSDVKKYMDTYNVDMVNPKERGVAMKVISGSNARVSGSTYGYNGDVWRIDLGNKNINLSAYVDRNNIGTYSKIAHKFQQYIKTNKPIAFSETSGNIKSVGYYPTADGSNNMSFTFTANINKDDVVSFLKQYNNAKDGLLISEKSILTFCKSTGAVPVDVNGKSIYIEEGKPGKLQLSRIRYFAVPFSRDITNNATEFSDLDNAMDLELYGLSNASKYATNRLIDGINK